jgi:hypothetical protein
MSLLGKAALAMWWNVRPEQREEFGDWHSHEHFPERLSIGGFRRGSRWSGVRDAEGFFVLYELATYATLTSKAYLDRLNGPTPWSTKMMPHHLGMVRSQCRIVASFGGGIAATLATIRLSPRAGAEQRLETTLIEMLRDCPDKRGLTGAHLLVTDTPPTSHATTEQRIRGNDAAADWIVLVSGRRAAAHRRAAEGDRGALQSRLLHDAARSRQLMLTVRAVRTWPPCANCPSCYLAAPFRYCRNHQINGMFRASRLDTRDVTANRHET